jgi:S-adenosylmethionine:tRNA ribosyltransferase-isomerase
MKIPVNIHIDDFDYSLPDERIAQYPLDERDHSRLLICKEDKISEDLFYNINKHLPEKCTLVFNDTKVIHARLLFRKETGSLIELFCLEPYGCELQTAFQQKETCEWKCLVGNNKRWKSGLLKLKVDDRILFAEKIKQEGENFIIRFSWKPASLHFIEVIEIFGKVPLPPYISRSAEDKDEATYQTVYAKYDGSVAAPTAGLHFTEKVFGELDRDEKNRLFLTLHVGAGTFKPVTANNIAKHEMHEEHFSVSRQFISSLLVQIQNKRSIIPVGTTSLRTIESLYWLGVKCLLQKSDAIFLDQWEAYEFEELNYSAIDALQALLDEIDKFNTSFLHGATRMIIVPGYKFKIANGIITNFHQPRSTLLLLVAAMIGERWKQAYDYALENNFRFLSYGDCCLFMKH